MSTSKPSQPPVANSIAARAKSLRASSMVMLINKIESKLSIAEWVKAYCREQIHTVMDMETGKLLKYRKLMCHPKFKDIWNTSTANEFRHLAQCIGRRVKGTDTIWFIHKAEVPADRWKDITYIKFACTVQTKKKKPN
jgi:hypothetical protein